LKGATTHGTVVTAAIPERNAICTGVDNILGFRFAATYGVFIVIPVESLAHGADAGLAAFRLAVGSVRAGTGEGLAYT
jgi:hypothetical protein